jgi:hypothetical protein
MWEAEVRRITVPSHPGQKSFLNRKRLGIMVCTCHSSNSIGSLKLGGQHSRPTYAKSETLSAK